MNNKEKYLIKNLTRDMLFENKDNDKFINNVVKYNQDYVKLIVNQVYYKFTNKPVSTDKYLEFDDFIQMSNIAFFKSIKSYNKTINFGTYLRFNINRVIMKHLFNEKNKNLRSLYVTFSTFENSSNEYNYEDSNVLNNLIAKNCSEDYFVEKIMEKDFMKSLSKNDKQIFSMAAHGISCKNITKECNLNKKNAKKIINSIQEEYIKKCGI